MLDNLLGFATFILGLTLVFLLFRVNYILSKMPSRMAKATQFTLQRRGLYQGEPTETIMVEWRGDDRWVVTNGLEVLNSDDEWEHEPRPSNRDDAFKARTRMSLDEAFARAHAVMDKDRLTPKAPYGGVLIGKSLHHLNEKGELNDE